MPTTTTRRGYTKPLSSELYNISVPNANWDLADIAPGYAIQCTSSTNPGSPADGDIIFETDSGNVKVRSSGAWKLACRVFICTSGTRPGSALTGSGFPIYETDTGNHYIRDAANTTWVFVSGPKLASAYVFSWNNDTQLYRNGAGQLKTDGTMFAGNFAENNGTATVENTQAAAGTTTSTSFTATLSGAGAVTAGVAFVAPASGKVIVHNTMALGASSVTYVYSDIEVRTGGTVGSGTQVRAPSITTCMRNADGNYIRNTVTNLVSSLTPGSTYNVRQMFVINAGTTLNTIDRNILVCPVIY